MVSLCVTCYGTWATFAWRTWPVLMAQLLDGWTNTSAMSVMNWRCFIVTFALTCTHCLVLAGGNGFCWLPYHVAGTFVCRRHIYSLCSLSSHWNVGQERTIFSPRDHAWVVAGICNIAIWVFSIVCKYLLWIFGHLGQIFFSLISSKHSQVS